MPQALRNALVLKVTLRHIEPEIWRRVRLPSTTKLPALHRIFQVLMGWSDSHLHQFIVDRVRYGIPDPDFDDGTENEARVTIASLLKQPGDTLIYEYDFGDGWEHDVLLEKVQAFRTDEAPIACIDGARSCPPEDVGGPPGYEHFLEAYADPKHPEHRDMRRWAGKHFQPEHFPLAEINAELSRLRRV